MRFDSVWGSATRRILQQPFANDIGTETYVYPASLFRRGSVSPPTGRIPREIVEFFNAPGGHSLIAKGPAGTGKTTFALQLTEALGEVTASHYLSSRVSDESLYRQFTWLKDRIKPAILQTGSKSAHNTKVARHALDQLEGKLEEGKEGEDEEPEAIGSGEVKGNFLEVTLGFDLPELEAAYDFVDDRIPARSLVLIDSIDALAEHYGIPAGRLITVLQKDLVEGSKQNVLYVLESSGETRLDYLGDGVVSLASTDHQGRRLRVLTIEKLRGQQIQQHRYLYTLDGGRLTAFDIREEVRPVKPQLWRPVKDLSKDAVSFGLEPLDRLTGGLYRGRVVAFEISNAVPSDYVDWLRTAIICNFVAQGRGVAHVPPRKWPVCSPRSGGRTTCSWDSSRRKAPRPPSSRTSAGSCSTWTASTVPWSCTGRSRTRSSSASPGTGPSGSRRRNFGRSCDRSSSPKTGPLLPIREYQNREPDRRGINIHH